MHPLTRKDLKLTHEHLLAELAYNPETGAWRHVYFKKGQSPNRPVGCLNKSTGYNEITLDGVKYKAPRLAFFYQTGRWPVEEVDHKNRIPHDDRWLNLEEVSSGENQKRRRPFKEWNLGPNFGSNRFGWAARRQATP